MNRREFLAISSAATCSQLGFLHAADGPGFSSPAEAMKAPKESLLYVTALYCGAAAKQPDYIATVDVDPRSPNYSKVIHRLPMPNVGDELHHFGWNTCSSCHGEPGKQRRYLVVPGLGSGRIHIVDAVDPKAPRMHKVLEPQQIKAKTNLSAPHTVHCLADGTMMISMLGDGDGNGPGGFLHLDSNFDIIGRWDKDNTGMKSNYDFWYQPHHNVMVSSEWGAPKTYSAGFKPADVGAGKYGRTIHFWDWNTKKIQQSIDLGPDGLIPLEVRFFHDPKSMHGFVGAALSSSMWHWHNAGGQWKADKVIAVDPVTIGGQPVPGLITDLVVSMDDRYLYFSNWLHGDLRQYDISNPAQPKLVGQLWIGGLLGKAPTLKGQKLRGGPQMLQLSLDGQRLYVTNSLQSAWDDQFYPDLAKSGSHLLQIDCDTKKGGLKLNENFFVDFANEPNGPARAHEMRYPGGDCTSDIFT